MCRFTYGLVAWQWDIVMLSLLSHYEANVSAENAVYVCIHKIKYVLCLCLTGYKQWRLEESSMVRLGTQNNL